MKSNELRIGNLLRDKVSGEFMVVDELPGVNIGAVLINREKYPLPKGWQMEYVPLTPDLLTQLGFEKDGYEDATWYQKDFPVVGQLCTSDREHPLGNFLFDTNTDTLKIHYLHQLQNLYFALTGEELNVQPISDMQCGVAGK